MATFYFNSKTNTIWNKFTLKEYAVNADAASLIKTMKKSPESISEEDGLALNKALASVGISLTDLEILSSSSRCLQTPIVHVIKNCNSKCTICDCWKTSGSIMLPASSLRRFWRQATLAGAKSVMISGGEPILHPELVDIIHDVKSCGLGIELNTNGILLDKNQWIEREHIDALVVSIDGFNSNDYFKIRGCNEFEHVLNNIKQFKRKSKSTLIGGRVTLTSVTLSSLLDSRSLMSKSGIDVLSFSPLDATSTSFSREMDSRRSGELINKFIPTQDELERYLDDFETGGELECYVQEMCTKGYFAWGPTDFIRCIKYYLTLLRNETWNQREWDSSPCMFPQCSLVVDYDGSILPCFYGKSYCSIEDFDAEKWNPIEFSRLMQESDFCKGCRGKVFCGV